MIKKITYLLILVGILILGYFNYYKEEEGIKEVSTKIETIDVTYNSLGYKIKANKQIDDMKLNTTIFEKSDVRFENMSLKADKVLLNSAKDLFLENNIYGNNGEGWEFNSEKLTYSQLKDLLSSDTGLRAYNKQENLEIYSTIFRTNRKFSYINLENKVTLINKDLKLSSDKGRYTSSNNIMTLSGNGKIESGISNENSMKGNFEKARYNNETKILEVFSPFEINYNGVILKGKELWYNDFTKQVKINKDSEVYFKNDSKLKGYEGKEGKFTSDKMNGNLDKMIFNFRGNAVGKMSSLDVKSNKKILSTYKGDNLKIYLKKKKSGYEISKIHGRDKVFISRGNQIFKSDILDLNLDEKMITGEKNNEIILSDSNGKTILIGDKFKGNLDEKIFNMIGNVKIKNTGKSNKITTIIGEKGTVNDIKKTSEIEGNVKLENADIICTADRIIYNKITNKANTFGKTLVNYKSK